MKDRTSALPRPKNAFAARHALLGAAILAAAILITELLRNHFDFAQHNLVLLYVMAVLTISCTSPGYAYGLVAAVAGALACDFLIVYPRLGFSFTAGSPVTLAMLLAITLTTSTMASRLRQQKKLAVSQQEHFELLYQINRDLLSARSVGAIVDLINTSLEGRLGRPVTFFIHDPAPNCAEGFKALPDTPETAALFLTGPERKRIHALFQGGPSEGDEYPAGRRRNIYYEPVVTNAGVAGVIGVYQDGRQMSPEETVYLQTLAGQAALAFEVQQLSDKQEKLLVDTEKEKTRSILLRSISHDFRTPLATIRGASAAIREQPDMPCGVREKLLHDIEEYADWLTKTMENILTITRLSGKPLHVAKKEEAAEEVISATVTIIRKRYPERRVSIQIPETMVLVPMDATLIAQVIINLLENAIKNSPPDTGVSIRLVEEGETAVFQVIDEGFGIAPEQAGDLFRPYLPPEGAAGDARRYKGIGLSICKTIIDAHRGEIDGYNRETGGAVFSFRLPLREHAGAV